VDYYAEGSLTEKKLLQVMTILSEKIFEPQSPAIARKTVILQPQKESIGF